MVGVSEAMALGDALGIDTKVLAGIINSSTGRCWSSDTYNPWPGIIERHRPRVATPAASVPN
jgi:3-hydroxyisobutyrate dehydrogenase